MNKELSYKYWISSTEIHKIIKNIINSITDTNIDKIINNENDSFNECVLVSKNII